MPATINIINQPTVTLLTATPDAERVVALAARTCYSADEIAKINLTDEAVNKLVKRIVASGHGTPLEHASFTFGIDGVSRSLTHQLVRHRIASFDEKSQRYVKFSNSLDIVMPPQIAKRGDTAYAFLKICETSFETYKTLLDEGIDAEDARYLLPHAGCTNIVMTANAREWRHILSLRCCNRAQWEIRQLMWAIREKLVELAPTLFADAGPGCMRGSCPEGTMSCGHPYPST